MSLRLTWGLSAARQCARYAGCCDLPRSLAGAARAGDVRQAGAQIVVAGDQGQQRGDPQQDLADRCDRQKAGAGIADDQNADRHHLDRRLPFGEPRDRHADAQPGEILAQARKPGSRGTGSPAPGAPPPRDSRPNVGQHEQRRRRPAACRRSGRESGRSPIAAASAAPCARRANRSPPPPRTARRRTSARSRPAHKSVAITTGIARMRDRVSRLGRLVSGTHRSRRTRLQRLPADLSHRHGNDHKSFLRRFC